MSKENSSIKTFYFSTRDLLVMSVLSALGGVSSTYVNTLSDAVHAALGFPGATQWAAGLHTIWIVLAMGILRKPGTSIFIGILKGIVELMSGNSHGVIIILINLVAGLLVDFGFLLFNKKQNLIPYLVGGGLATASNVLVFQLFATIPLNILGVSSILILFFVAMVSGLIFAGVVPFMLVNTLTKAGVVKVPEKINHFRKLGWWIVLGVSIVAILLAVFLQITFPSSQTVKIDGAVQNPYKFSEQSLNPDLVTQQMEYRGVMTEYTGYPMKEIIEHANPLSVADTILLEASDGYSFLISFEELTTNPNILFVPQGKGQNASYDIVGPESSKAWVRSLSKITLIHAEGLTIINPDGSIHLFAPDDWAFDMDSTQISLPGGSQKLQGVSVYKIVEATFNASQPAEVTFRSNGESLTLDWSKIDGNDALRIFTVIEENGISFTLAEMSGDVLLYPLNGLEFE